jgi:transcriptional regulator with XRE-family HTH domain
LLEKTEILEMLSSADTRQVAIDTGISYQTIWRLLTGRAPYVTYDIIEKLSQYFEGIE